MVSAVTGRRSWFGLLGRTNTSLCGVCVLGMGFLWGILLPLTDQKTCNWVNWLIGEKMPIGVTLSLTGCLSVYVALQ